MNYLFFDIECCDGIHICSFGFVVVDKNFNIIKKSDVIINPEKAFKLGKAGEEAKLTLSYPQETFLKQKNFSHFYEYIKSLLLENVVFGHSVKSDVGFVNIACARYRLKRLKYTAYDTQKMYKELKGDKDIKSLGKIVSELQINVKKLEFHKSCDDAEFSMNVAKKICEINNCSLDDLIVKYKDCSVRSDKLKKKKKHKHKKFFKLFRQKQREKLNKN